MSRRTRMTTVTIDVDLDDFDDEEIEDEYEARGLGGGDLKDQLRELFYAFHFGQNDKAMELARQIAQDATGRVLGA